VQNDAAHCLAFAGQIYSNLWSDYIRFKNKRDGVQADDEAAISECLTGIFVAAEVSVCNMQSLGMDIQSLIASKQSGAPYLGFDARDVAAYNLSDDYNDHTNNSNEEQRQADLDRCKECVMVYLLLLFQVFHKEVHSAVALVRIQRTNALLEHSGQDRGERAENVQGAVDTLMESNKAEYLRDPHAGVVGGCVVADKVKEKLRTGAATTITELASSLMHSSMHFDEEVGELVFMSWNSSSLFPGVSASFKSCDRT
jgi:hypothetical protein